MDDTNLSGLDLASAKDYIFAYAVDAKRLDKTIADAEAELDRWNGRLALAQAKLAADPSMATLVQAAGAKAEETKATIASLGAERDELRAKISVMREQLPLIKARERSIDPDRLLAELQMMTGELLGDEAGGRSQAATEADFAKLESEAKADSDLDSLKRKAAEGGQP
jgi:hypothetical protein